MLNLIVMFVFMSYSVIAGSYDGDYGPVKEPAMWEINVLVIGAFLCFIGMFISKD